jgi:hypothetical protein
LILNFGRCGISKEIPRENNWGDFPGKFTQLSTNKKISNFSNFNEK